MHKLGSKQISKAQLYRQAEADFNLIPQLIEGTASPKATIRYGCGSVLMDLSAKYPNELYSYMDNFTSMLDSKHRILTWNALAIIANLTAADSDRKFDAAFKKYYGFLGSEYMVTVANTVVNSAVIAKNKPYLADHIAAELFKVQNLKTTPHLTEECKRVIAEKNIETFNTLMPLTQKKVALLEFARQHRDSSREKLRREAQLFLKRWQ